MPDLVIDNVSKSFPTRTEPLVVLREVSFGLSAVQVVSHHDHQFEWKRGA